MSPVDRIDRIVSAVEDMCRFCPICGEELVVMDRTFGIPKIHEITIDAKVCPGGHGELTVDSAYDGPEVKFVVDEKIWTAIE